MRRVGARGEGKWARVSWDEALDEMADRLAEVRQTYGPEAIVGATSGAYFSRSVILALTLRSIGSPNWMINQDLCGGCRAVSARITGLDITRGEDIDNTRCALSSGATRASPIRSSGRRSRRPRSAAPASSWSTRSARRPRRSPTCGWRPASAPMPRWRSP